MATRPVRSKSDMGWSRCSGPEDDLHQSARAAISRSNQAGPSSSGAVALISGATSTAPRVIRSMQTGYSPLDAHDPRSDSSRGHDHLQRQRHTRRQVPNERDRSAFARATNRLIHGLGPPHDLEYVIGPATVRSDDGLRRPGRRRRRPPPSARPGESTSRDAVQSTSTAITARHPLAFSI